MVLVASGRSSGTVWLGLVGMVYGLYGRIWLMVCMVGMWFMVYGL